MREKGPPKPGLYESLITRGLAADLEALGPEFGTLQETLDKAEAPRVLSQHLAERILQKLESIKDAEQRVDLVNGIASLLEDSGEETVGGALLQLMSVHSANRIAKVVPIRPAIPLSSTDLLVNARGEHRIGAELIKELTIGQSCRPALLVPQVDGLQDAGRCFHGVRRARRSAASAHHLLSGSHRRQSPGRFSELGTSQGVL